MSNIGHRWIDGIPGGGRNCQRCGVTVYFDDEEPAECMADRVKRPAIPLDRTEARHRSRIRYLALALAPKPLAALLDAALEDLRLAGGDGDDIMLLIQRAQRERNSQK